MAQRDLVRLLVLSDAPLARPEGIVRLPLERIKRLGGAVGGYLGMLLFPAVILVLPTEHLSPDGKGLAYCGLLVVGSLLGVGLGWTLARPFAERKAILFDANGIWEERDGAVSEPLPWAGLRLQEGRLSTLVAEDDRTLKLRSEGFLPGPESRYLVALLRELPTIEAKRFPPTPVLWVLLAASFALMVAGGRLRPPLDADGPYWSPQRIEFLLALMGGLVLFMRSVLPLLGRHGARPGKGRKEESDSGGAEIAGLAALFRAHRFRPPLVTLRQGVTYRYSGDPLWSTRDKSQREAKISLAGMGLFLGLLCIAATFVGPRRSGRTDLTGIWIGGFCILFFVGLALLIRPPKRGGLRIRILGDRAYASADGLPETLFPWPAVRTREATEFLDWTDELRAEGRRLRIDRRLLVPVADGRAEERPRS